MQQIVRNDRKELSVPSEDSDLDLIEILATLWRGRWVIGVCALIALLVGAFYAYGVAVPKYAATVQVMLRGQGQQLVDIQSVVSGVSTDAESMNTELQVIQSRKLAEQLVDQLNLTTDPDFNPFLQEAPTFSLSGLAKRAKGLVGMEVAASPSSSEEQIHNATVDRVLGSISAAVLRGTRIFDVEATTVDAGKSVLLANTLAELYIADQIAVKFEATERAVAWLSQRVSELEADLKAKEEAVKELRAGSGLVSAEGLAALNQQAKDLRARLEELQGTSAQLRETQAKLEELRDAGDADAMQAAFPDPVLKQLFQRISEGEPEARELFDSRFDLLLQREANGLQRTLDQAAALDDSYTELQRRIEAQSADLVRLQQLERDAGATRVLYETFLTRQKETTVQRGLQEADARILSPAVYGRHVEPRKSLIMALTTVLGLVIGSGMVLLRQVLHNGFRTAEVLEQHTGTTVLGQIPRIPISARQGLIDYLNAKPTSAASEAVRNLRTSVLLSNIDHPPKVIMSTSSLPGEGKTTQAIALTHNLSKMGKRVLLIEGDIRRRTFTQYFKDVPKGGILTALAGEQPLSEVVFFDQRLGADVLMGEKSNINAADLFSSDKFYEFMHRAREAYDFVVVDTPPVLVVPDARVIGQSVDAILYSVNWDKTTKAQVDEGLRQFRTANLRITGTVLSQIDPKGMRRYGYGGKYSAYGAYSGYGSGYYDA
ncbi:Wzz/FepE/Etk N-terminal domain-containing protein [Aquicoccus sp. SU-CL01552]|uniref:Wzz/FepE/Etk N-terminal domain-containing protein n=1 Tax=Aquicoccus sp. SU-CL01552 TaxID=3127656 RepID=UPI0033422441